MLSVRVGLPFFTVLVGSTMQLRVHDIYKITDVCVIFIVKEVVIKTATYIYFVFF